MFKNAGGELILSCLVKKIQVKDNTIQGVFLDTKRFIPSKYVVSCCDARQTFLKLLGRHNIDNNFLNMLKRMTPSLSFFLVYLGVDKYFQSLPKPGVCVWIMPNYNIDDMYLSLKNKNITESSGYMFRVSPNKKSLQAFVNAPFKNKRYWTNNKNIFLEAFIKRIENIVPELSKHLVFKEAATPHTLNRYTLNYKGAAYGWASTPSQLFTSGLTQTTLINNLYLSGHWTTQTQGVSGAAYIGYETAKLVLRKKI
jgi:phytoene dehydrogenase-like protein